MGMSIRERMALQARAAAASHVKPVTTATTVATVSAASRVAKQASVVQATASSPAVGAPPEATATSSSMGAAQRIARQGNVAKQNSAAAARMAPPPEPAATVTMSAAERIRKQAIVAVAQKAGTNRAEVNEQVLADIRAKYAVFLAEIEKEMSTMGPMYFVPNQATEAKAEEVADKVNGISTAEGEMVVEAQPSEPVPNMPYQATPVIETRRKPRRKKASETETA